MPQELSLLSVVLCFAAGLLLLCLLFVFAKRHFRRLTLKPPKRAHGTIGSGVPKELGKEILRRIQQTNEIRFEPQLIHDRCEAKPNSLKDSGVTCNYKYRMLALDAFSSIDVTLANLCAGHKPRHPNMTVRSYLFNLHHKGPLLGASTQLMNEYADAYDRARHSPKEFGQNEYKEYIELLQQLISFLQPVDSIWESQQADKVEMEVFYHEDRHSSPVETKTIPPSSDIHKSGSGVLQGMQTRLRGTSKHSVKGDQQALLGSVSSARSSEGHSDQGSVEKLVSSTAESSC